MSLLVNTAFTSDDVDTLRGVVNSWCREHNVSITSSEAQSVASVALDLFQSGHDTGDKLTAALHEIKGF